MSEIIANNKIQSCVFTFRSIKKRGVDFKVDFTSALNIPIIYNSVLDETLDTAKIVLSDLKAKDYEEYFMEHGLDISEAFEVNSFVEIKFEKLLNGRYVDQETSLKMYIAHDDCRVQRKSENSFKSYKHSLTLIELIKETERISVDTLTFTNPLIRKYDAQSDVYWMFSGIPRSFSWETVGKQYGELIEQDIPKYVGWNPPVIPMLLQKQDNYELSDNLDTCNNNATDPSVNYLKYLKLTVTTPSYKILNFEATLNKVKTDGAKTYYERGFFNLPLNEVGVYILEFNMRVHMYGSSVSNRGNMWDIKYVANVAVSATGEFLNSYRLSDTINRLLDTTPLHNINEASQYIFDEKQLQEYAQEESPEFAFTGHTLFEALLQVSSYKGAFPCLDIDKDNKKVLSFRTFWNGVRKTEDDLPEPYDDISSTDIEQYCTHIDAEIQNFVGVNNGQVGTVIEPYASGWKSTRAESGSEISQDTAIILTDYNMYLHTQEEFGILYEDNLMSYDVTAYVYESGDYQALSDYYAGYPMSKSYAIEWTQMGQNITELSHRIKSDSEILRTFKEPAICNIIQAKTGISYSSGIVSYLSSLIGLDNSQKYGFSELMFKSSYIPIINARVTQYKESYDGFHHIGSIKNNQSADLVDSEMYGEYSKELLRKLGNKTKRKIYTFKTLDEIPKVGTVVGNYSVYDIQMSIRENLINATISYVKYAELSKYIGVKNPWKDSDVSMDKCYDRKISYNGFLLFTHDNSLKSTALSVSSRVLEFLLPQSKPHTITCAQAQGFTAEENGLNTVLLPVVSLAVGNSILFHWKYLNNYSAGYMSQPAPDGATSAISGTKYDRAQKAVKYTDSYGRLEFLSYYLMPDGPTSEEAAITRQIAHSLPLFPEIVDWEWHGEYYFSIEKLKIRKNSSEALTFETQYHFVTDITSERENSDFIIGSGLSNFCPLVGGAALSIGVYGFTERINIFNRRISVNEKNLILEGQLPFEVITGGSSKALKITIPRGVNNKNSDGSYKYKAWAYVGKTDDRGSYQIIFGENKGLDETVAFKTTVYLLPMHKLEDFI